MSRIVRLVVYLLVTLALIYWYSGRQHAPPAPTVAVAPAPGGPAIDDARAPDFLPPEAIETLQAIARGGPFPYDRDGVVFQNREGRLPEQPRGYYHEYTVTTPGSRDRGARRIIAGGNPPTVYYYTDDHYRSFRPVEWPP
jgi:guanyl-specific ribonuclease Sa